MNKIECPICRSINNKLHIRSKDYSVLKGKSDEFDVFFCRNCENGFSLPFLNKDELSKYYPSDYECYKSHRNITGYIQKLKSGKDISLVSALLKEKNKEILEVGAGSGLFMHLLKERSVKVSGIEMNISGVQYAKENFGIDLENCFFEDYNSSKKFDMIIAFHVLEHFNDPVSVINKMRTLLKEDGYIFLKVPRLDSWASKLYGKFWHGYDLPRHRVHFTKNGIINLLSVSGFKTEYFKNDLGPLDTIRAIKHYSQYGDKKFNKYILRFINFLPFLIKLPAAVLFDLFMSPFHSGRMSIIARKIQK